MNNGTCHVAFPETGTVEDDLNARVAFATLDLITNDLALGRCNCISVNSCPDLDGDGDIDVDDWQIMQGNVTGPASGSLLRGPIAGDIDVDGDVDLRDFRLFQQAFSPPQP